MACTAQPPVYLCPLSDEINIRLIYAICSGKSPLKSWSMTRENKTLQEILWVLWVLFAEKRDEEPYECSTLVTGVESCVEKVFFR